MLLALPVLLSAQQYGNEWINPAQTYFKIPIAETGIYRLSQAQLQGAGFPTSIDPRKIQIFHRGTEQAVRVIGEEDGSFDATDFVEFYATRNDGTLDRELYFPNFNNHLNPFYNSYNDTTAYFLTYRMDSSNGKRMPFVDAPNTGYSPEPFYFQESIRVFSEQYSPGRNYVATANSFAYISNYDTGEGFASNPLGASAFRDISFPVSQANSSSGVRPYVELRFVSRLQPSSVASVSVGASTASLRNILNASGAGYNRYDFGREAEWSDFPAGNGNVVVRTTNTGGGAISLVYLKLTYTRLFNAEGLAESRYLLRNNPGNISYIEIANAPNGALLYDISDSNNLRIINTTNSSTLNAVITNTATARNLFLCSNFRTASGIRQVSFQNINPSLFDYLIVSHPTLMRPAAGYSNVIQAYADYRASQQGGSFRPLVMDINLLYDQFNYGEKSPLAIRRFAKYMYDQGQPKHLFLIGRAITLRAIDTQFPSYAINFDIRTNPAHQALNLVPTFGHPGADLPFTAGFEAGLPNANALPTGRLNVSSPLQVATYLNKVKEHETIGGDFWRKRILHLSGGISVAERNNFKVFVDLYKSVAEGDFLRGLVKTVSKRTSETVEFLNIAEEINQGVGLLTFFGHSGVSVTDIDIGRCSEDVLGYRNKGRYPMILGNGCSLGDVYSGTLTLADDWLYTPDRGAIAWMAHSQLGAAFWLHNYSTRFYNFAYGASSLFGEPLGVLRRQVARSYGNDFISDLDLIHFQQMTLQGDPAVKLVPGNLPDLHTEDAWLSLRSFDNSPITAKSDSFQLQAVVANIARSTTQKYEVSVRRILSNGSSIEYTTFEEYGPTNFLDTLRFTITRPQGLSTFGNNRFEIKIDYKDSIPENNEQNNTAAISLLIPDVGARAAFPLEYSIVNSQPLRLVAQAGTVQNASRDFIFELDTTATFSSPAKRQSIVTGNSSATWEVNLLTDLLPSDSIVYYWRVNFADAVSNPNVLWDESSFTYIKNSPPGWTQRRFPQFAQSSDQNIVKDALQKRWNFRQAATRIQVNAFGSTNPEALSAGFSNVFLAINGLPFVFQSNPLICANNALICMAIDRDTKLPYLVSNVGICGRRPERVNAFTPTQLSNGTFAAWVYSLKPGDYVVVFNKGNIPAASWSAIRPLLQEVGASLPALATLGNGHPYILVGQRGGQALREVIAGSIATPTAEAINLDYSLTGGFTEGSVLSTRIGPASSWRELQYQLRSLENPITDENRLDIIGQTINGQESVLYEGVSSGFNLSGVEAFIYPYLRLRLHTKDESNETPTQLQQWLVLFEGVAEGFLNVDKVGAEKYVIKDKQEGERFTLPFAFENIGGRTFDSDSLLVRYTLINRSQNSSLQFERKIRAPGIGETIFFDYEVETLNQGGENNLRVFVNPQIEAEQNFDNNILEINYKVIPDDRNPLLDVTFDGVKILDGEIVSPNPLISIRLQDENPFIPRSDTSGLEIQLRAPCDGCGFRRIYFSNPDLRWWVREGTFQVEYQPRNLEDGIYTLRVQGADAKGNTAGVQPYQIGFEVINEASVTNFFPYPNPFSGSTRFVFTLTGAELPQELKIQIMTVTGKVVREITQEELGPIRIGNNISQYAWDGTDEFGDKLANGVYLYRVILRLNGQSIKKRETAGDRAFKKDFGKLYILR